MRLKKGDRLIGINPNTGQKLHYIYKGRNVDHPEWQGVTRKLHCVEHGIDCYVADSWAKACKVRKV